MNSQVRNIYSEQLLSVLKSFSIDTQKQTLNIAKRVVKIDAKLQTLIAKNDIKVITDEVYKQYNASNTLTVPGSEYLEDIQLNDLKIQEDRFWAIESEEKNGIIVARKNSERARIPAQSFYGIGEISLANKNGNNELNDSKSFIHAITSRKVARNEAELDSKLPKESFIYLYGKNILRDEYGEDTVRFYFNLKPKIEIIRKLVIYLSKALDEREIPYNLKYLSNLMFYHRSDSCVLYIHKQNFSIVAQVVKYCVVKFKNKDILQNLEPFFTRKLSDGVGFAENPLKKGSSFGMFKSSQIIQGIITYLKSQVSPFEYDPNKCLDFIIEKQLFDTQTPYLNADSRYFYDFKIFDEKKTINILNYKITKSDYLNAAQYFAKVIESKAIWLADGERTWLTYTQKNTLDEDIKGFRPVNENERKGIEFFLLVLDFILNLKSRATSTADLATPPSIANTVKNSENFVFDHIQEPLPKFDIITDEATAKILADKIIKNHIIIQLPVYNQFGNFEFNPTITHGLAFYGYLFLRVHDSINVPKITNKIMNKFLEIRIPQIAE